MPSTFTDSDTEPGPAPLPDETVALPAGTLYLTPEYTLGVTDRPGHTYGRPFSEIPVDLLLFLQGKIREEMCYR